MDTFPFPNKLNTFLNFAYMKFYIDLIKIIHKNKNKNILVIHIKKSKYFDIFIDEIKILK